MRRRKQLLPLWLALWMWVCLMPMARSADKLGGISGRVLGPDGRPLPAAQITITGAQLMGPVTLRADSQGFYRTVLLPPGKDYRVRLDAKDMHPYSVEVMLVQAGRITQLPTWCLTSAQKSMRALYPPDDSAPKPEPHWIMPAKRCQAVVETKAPPPPQDWMRW